MPACGTVSGRTINHTLTADNWGQGKVLGCLEAKGKKLVGGMAAYKGGDAVYSRCVRKGICEPAEGRNEI